MRNIKLLLAALTVAGLAALPLSGQEPTQNPSPTPQASPAQPSAPAPSSQQGTASATPSTANSPEANNTELRPVMGELEKQLDTKNAKPGDEVVLKTTEKATTADGVEIPKGSKIMGHVTEVTAHDNTNANSKLTLQFDQAQLKDGQTLPIRSVLQSIEGSGDNGMRADSMTTPTGSPAPMPSGGSGGMTGSSNAGGTGSRSPSAGSTNTAPAMSSQESPQSGNGPQAGQVVARQGNVEIKTTAIPNVLIGTSANGQPFSNASGVILGAKQNVHLDGGTKMVLAVAGNNKPTENR